MSENLWDSLAEKFWFDPNDENYFGASENVLFLWPAILKFLPLVEGKSILDFGCGTGTFCNYLYDSKAKVVGVDASIEMLNKAQTVNANIQFVQDVDTAPDNQGAVTSIHTFEFIRDIEIVFSNISSKLEAGGSFIFAVHDINVLNDFAKNDGSYIPSNTTDHMYDFGNVKVPIFPRTIEFYRDLLKSNGFKNIEIEYPLYSEEFKKKNNKNVSVKNWAVVFKAEK